jgi:DNA-binding beta-propeller fold protein YncE
LGGNVKNARGALSFARRGIVGLFAVALATAVLATVSSGAAAASKRSDVRPALFVGNNWDGTADVIQPGGRFRRLAHFNVVPDLSQRLLEIYGNPVRLAYFLAIRQFVGEGHDQFVDDMFSSRDGRYVYVSRPSLDDVVAIRLRDDSIRWRFPVAGQRADHMAISPDGKRLAVSASTAREVQIIDTRTGKEIGSFPSGDSPHENNFSRDGSRIFHASIGLVYTPTDEPQLDTTKGDRWFEIVNAKNYKVLRRIDMGEKLAEAGYPNMSSAVRPMAISPNERWLYFQVSFFHGFVEYDLKRDKVTRVAQLPNEVPNMPRENYLLDSAHHGIAMNRQGTRLCVAGTMDNYAAVVSRKTFKYRLLHAGRKPYWVTNSGDGRYCFISWSGDDRISAISYAKRRIVATVPVGDHPQRMRMGVIRRSYVR